MMRSYSSAVRPRPRARSRVTFGSAPAKQPPAHRLRKVPSSTSVPRSDWNSRSPSVPPIAALRDEITQGFRHGRLARDGARPQVIAVGEATGQDHAVQVGEIPVAMPDVFHGLANHFRDDIMEVAIAPRAWKHHDPESHEL